MRTRWGLLVIAVFLLGMFSGIALSKKSGAIGDSVYQGKTPDEAAAALMREAVARAKDDSWELLAVARAYYLGGNKEKGTALFNRVSANGESSDWAVIARTYWEAGEKDEAMQAFEKSLRINPNNEKVLAEFGAYLNVSGERERAEKMFANAFELGPKSAYLPTWAAGSYLGVVPRRR